jgi:hypothetical protein
MARVRWRLFEPSDQVEVPIAGGMDDETFLKHLEHRHAREVKFESVPVARRAMEAWLPVYRAFHDRLHALGPASHYDHTHEEDD